ncbi:zinc ABC transporter substrate-binding protein, partial [Campylobacter jejuni]|nr:zinc ABC transporter substrate-binding protein [Campylobacter jejuni]
VYHPSWTYFAKRYNLTQIPVEILGKEPKSKDLQKLITLMKNKNLKVIFVQNGFPENAAKTLAKECDAKIYKIDHLSYDWENELLKTADTFSHNL